MCVPSSCCRNSAGKFGVWTACSGGSAVLGRPKYGVRRAGPSATRTSRLTHEAGVVVEDRKAVEVAELCIAGSACPSG